MFLDFIKSIPDTLSSITFSILGFVFISMIVINLVIYKFSENKKSVEGKNNYLKIILGCLLGLVPGCGGAIAVTIMFKKKQMSLGGLIGAFITTTGEGAYVLLFAEGSLYIKEFLIITIVCFIIGVIVAIIIDKLQIKYSIPEIVEKQEGSINFSNNIIEKYGFYVILIMGSFISLLSVLSLFNPDIIDNIIGEGGFVGNTVYYISILFLVLTVIYYLIDMFIYESSCSNGIKGNVLHSVRDTAMISFYIIIGILVAGFIIDFWIGEDVFREFTLNLGVFLTLGAVLIGLSPGCSGFVVLSVFYIEGHIPFSALLAGSIATNGDAFFPLFALDRKLTLKVCIITGIIAFVVGVVTIISGLDFYV